MQVSVIMPAYNAARYIGQAVDSLMRETGDACLDVIVVDDGSTDGTDDVIRELSHRHPQVRPIFGEHRGVAAARNRGLDALPDTVQYVTFHDADDIAYPGRIARQLNRLEADRRSQVVYGLLHLFDVLDERSLLPAEGARSATFRGVSLSAGLYRRRVVDQVGRFDESQVQAEDSDFLFRLVETGAVIHMEEEVATYYRRHETNTTNDFRVARREFMKAVHKSVRRRRQRVGGGSVAPLPGDLFADRARIEEFFQSCPSVTPS